MQFMYTLHQSGYQATTATRPHIEAQLQAELAHAAWMLAGLMDPVVVSTFIYIEKENIERSKSSIIQLPV